MAQVNFRMDDNLKKQADELFNELGLNMSTAINIFINQTVRQGGIPFEITKNPDPYYSAANMRAITEAIKQAEAGQLSPHELIED